MRFLTSHFQKRYLIFLSFFFLRIRPPPNSTLFPHPPLFRSVAGCATETAAPAIAWKLPHPAGGGVWESEPPANDPPAPESVHATRAVTTWPAIGVPTPVTRSEEHTSELQSQSNLVCRLLLEK